MCLRRNTAIIHLKAISYRIPMPITQVVKSYDGFFDSLCPKCGGILPYEYIRYCPLCGQRLCWLFLDEAEELESGKTELVNDKRRAILENKSFLYKSAGKYLFQIRSFWRRLSFE